MGKRGKIIRSIRKNQNKWSDSWFSVGAYDFGPKPDRLGRMGWTPVWTRSYAKLVQSTLQKIKRGE